jgi:hypothetical protein
MILVPVVRWVHPTVVQPIEVALAVAGRNTNPETMHYFMNGLPKSILTNVLQLPVPSTYHWMKAKAVDAICSRVLIDTMTKAKTTSI